MKNLDLVYIAAPYAHESELVMQVRYEIINRVCTKIILDQRCSIFSPISHGHMINLKVSKEDSGFDKRGYWMDMDFKILRNCSNMFVLMMEGWEQSKGILEEIKFCKANNIEISFINVEDVFNVEDMVDIQRSLIDSETQLDILQSVVGKWAEETFKECSTGSILAHLGDEIESLKSANNTLQMVLHLNSRDDIPDNPIGDRSGVSGEAADVLMLLLHYCHKVGIDLGKEVIKKFDVNRSRKWSKHKNGKGYFSHIKQ